MDLETVRVAVSIGSLLFLALIWHLLHLISKQLNRMGVRVEAGLHCLHILAAEPAPDDTDDDPPLRAVPPA